MAANDKDKTNERNTKAFIRPQELENEYLRRLIFRYLPKLSGEQKTALSAYTTEIFGKHLDLNTPVLATIPPKKPLHVRGDFGVGKTQIPEEACRMFCKMVGLNFIKNPQSDWLPSRNDFLFTVIDMSGKSNISDIAGMISKQKLYDPEEHADGVNISAKIDAFRAKAKSWAEGIAGYSQIKSVADGSRISFIVTNKDNIAVAQDAAASLKELLDRVQDPDIAIEFKVSIAANELQVDCHVTASPVSAAKATAGDIAYQGKQAVYASQLLPNKQIALAEMSQFGMIVLDDIGNLHPGIRNVFLQLALDGVVQGIADLRNVDIAMTSNPAKSSGFKNTNVQSDASPAEITRTINVELESSAKDWIRYVERKPEYQNGMDCHFTSFVDAYKDVSGIFKFETNIPLADISGLPTPRSYETAIRDVQEIFILAKVFGDSVTDHLMAIEEKVKRSLGNKVASTYASHVRSIETEAIPMAKDCIDNGRIDETKFAKKTNRVDGTGIDVMFRFAYALADIAGARINDLKKEDPKINEKVSTIFSNMCHGLSLLDMSIMNASLTRFKSRLETGDTYGIQDEDRKHLRKLNPAIIGVLTNAFAASIKHFDDPKKATENFSATLSGATVRISSAPRP